MTVEIGIIAGLASCIIGAMTFYAGRHSLAKKDGVAEGELKSDIKYIKEDIEEIKEAVKKYDDTKTVLLGLQRDIDEVKKSLSRAHTRIDFIEGGEKK